MSGKPQDQTQAEPADTQAEAEPKPAETPAAEEIGGPQGPEPTRFGDWEKAGRCTDF